MACKGKKKGKGGKGYRARMFYGSLCVAGGVVLTGCGLLEPTLRPSDGLWSTQKNQKITAEMLQATPKLQEETTETFGPDGQVVSRTSKTVWGFPPVVGSATFRASSEFANQETALSSITDHAGSTVEVGRKSKVDGGSYADGVQGQVLRGDQAVAVTGAIVEGAVKAAIEAVVPIQLDRQAQHTARTQIRADRDVRMAELAPAPEGE